MHKGLEFLTEKEKKDVNEYFVPEGKRNIIFLDIDGVLQPYSSWLRDDHDIDATIKYLCSKYDPEVVTRGDKYDVCAAYYDWNEIAVARLIHLCRHKKFYIVMSTDWRLSNDLERFRLFLSFYGLEDYLLDTCEVVSSKEVYKYEDEHGCYIRDKSYAIKKWIDTHKDMINKYLVIDDEDFTFDFGASFLRTDNIMSDEDLRYARFLSFRVKNIVQTDNNELSVGNTRLLYEITTISDCKVVFFRIHYSGDNSSSHKEDMIFERRCLLAELRYKLSGSRLFPEERAVFFILMEAADNPDDDHKILTMFRGISETTSRLQWDNNRTAVRLKADELWEKLS